MPEGTEERDKGGRSAPGTLRHIMVAIDGSESSLRAMAMAADLAKPFDARLVAISVASLPEYTIADFGGASPAVTELMREAAEDQARAALESAKGVARRRGAEVETLEDFGPVKETLLHAVAKHHPDVLVVGSRGLSPFKKLLLGSVSEAMIRYADCPVLVVK